MTDFKNTDKSAQSCENILTRSDFRSTLFPNLPYCSFEKIVPSTKYNESIHITNSKTKVTLSFYWRNDGQITVSTSDAEQKDPSKNNDEKYSSKKFNSKIASDLCMQFLLD